MKRPELLAPAGDLEKLQMAVVYGADAVYLAGKAFGLRAFAGNFTDEDMRAGIDFAHAHGAKVYVTVNIFAHNHDLVSLETYLQNVADMNADGLIVADPGVVDIARKTVPQVPIHLSTQANTTNYASAAFWFNLGVRRIVLARELTLPEIKEIRRQTAGELEMFVHGAMCMSYSGRCLLSNYLTGRDANRGECAQPCRWGYALVEETRPGQFLPIEEDERGTYIFNSFDLSLLEHLPQIIEAGIDSLKIEGRMKSINYVASVVKTYRQALDSYFADPKGYEFRPEWAAEIAKVSHRDYSTGFLFGRPGAEAQNMATSGYKREYDFVAVVKGFEPKRNLLLLEQRNKFSAGEVLEISGPKGEPFTVKIDKMYDENLREIMSAPHAQQKVWLPVDRVEVEEYSLVRREKGVAKNEQ